MRRKRLYFLSEMPVSNGVIRSQLLPVVSACAEAGYETVLVETRGRFDGQEDSRSEALAVIEKFGLNLRSISVRRETMLPSILRFFRETRQLLGDEIGADPEGVLIYARNYKFIPFLLMARKRWGIPFVYSPRAAYVAERKHYGRWRDRLFAPLIGWLERRAFLFGETAIVETASFRDRLARDFSIDPGRFSVIPNCYDESLLPPADWDRESFRRQLGFGGRKVIAYAGTLEAWYEFERMADLVSRLREKDPEILFQLFLKEDYARPESRGLRDRLSAIMKECGLEEGEGYVIAHYSPSDRYRYLSACDAGICLSIPASFKADMLYLKIVDYVGARLPMIVNRDMVEAARIVERGKSGAIVDYADWDGSVERIDPSDVFGKKFPQSVAEAYASTNIVPKYLELFGRIFEGMSR